ncbi:putative cytochrome P450 [Helianthus anomalus]
MAYLEYTTILSSIFILLSIVTCIYRSQKQSTIVPTNWPVLGMIPGILANAHRLYDYIIEVAMQTGGTFMWKGPSFVHMDMLFTTNPLDINHILSKNFRNYPKGHEFRKIFDILGEGIINSEGELWEINRKVTMSVLKQAGFQNMLKTILWNKVEKGLLPMLESICGHGAPIDLQDIFQRFTFDTIITVVFDHDPESLSIDFPHVACQKALLDVEEALLFRHLTPPCLWKMQKFLGIGKEKKSSEARIILDQFIYKCIAQKQKEYNNMNHEHQDEKFILITALMREMEEQSGNAGGDRTKFLRDILLDLILAGKDTISSALSWFFYNLTKNPILEHKILEEIHKHLDVKGGKIWDVKELSKLVYLHGALCESLRLFPPVPFNLKVPLQPDNLPSGHKVHQHTRIILPLYAMGRMKLIWGDDCMEFNPERWISKGGGIKHEPSYKFVAFGSGPRACVGKDMALSQLKIVSTTIIYHYHIDLVEGHCAVPTNAIILHMKHGLKVRLTKRVEVN